jgi:hypothetical protein
MRNSAGGIEARIEVFGLGQALKDLNKIDKVLRRDITKDYKRVTAGLVSDIQSAIPLNYPLSGWQRQWNLRGQYEVFPWPTSHSVKAHINTKAPKEVFGGKVNLSTFAVKWLGAAASFFDFSESNRMGAALTAKYGSPSRVVWKQYEANKSELEVEMARIVDRVGEALSRDLSAR